MDCRSVLLEIQHHFRPPVESISFDLPFPGVMGTYSLQLNSRRFNQFLIYLPIDGSILNRIVKFFKNKGIYQIQILAFKEADNFMSSYGLNPHSKSQLMHYKITDDLEFASNLSEGYSIRNATTEEYVKYFQAKRDLSDVHQKLGLKYQKEFDNLVDWYPYFTLNEKGTVVATAEFMVIDDFVYLSGAQTEEQYRNQGVYTNLLHHRLHKVDKLGISDVYVIANVETSASILEKFDFSVCQHLRFYRIRPQQFFKN